MKRLFDPGFWARALKNPIVLAGLAVDLAPIYAVLVWGWGAAPLVLIYWAENVITGVMTLPRIFISAANYGVPGMLIGAFLCAFFTVHYGMFCTVHGFFVITLSQLGGAWGGGPDAVAVRIEPVGSILDNLFLAIPAMIRFVMASAPHADWILAIIFVWQIVVFVWEFILKAGWKRSNPAEEMFAPYGRIIALHIGIFAGFGALLLLGQPMLGVLALILLRAVWGVLTNERVANPQPKPEAAAGKAFDDAMKQLGKSSGAS